MNETIKMQISAFVDGELPDNESELLLRRLSQDAAMRQQVAEYLHIGRHIRRDIEVPGMNGLRQRIAAALGDEALPESGQPQVVGSKLMTPTTGIAVAATVAAIALIGLSQIEAPVDTGVQGAVALDLGALYTEPTPEQVDANPPGDRVVEYTRRHGRISTDDIIYRMATFKIDDGLVEIEPDPHLLPAEEQADSDSPTEERAEP